MTDTIEPIDALAYPPALAAKMVGRSHSRIKKAIREKELTARKDGRATLIEHAELQRWLASLRTIGRESVQEAVREPVHPRMDHNNPPEPMQREKPSDMRTARGSGKGRQARTRSTPPRPRSLVKANAVLEDTPRR